MHDRALGVVADVLTDGSPHLRAHVTDSIAAACGCAPDAAKQAVRDLLESRVIDPVTVCYYRVSDARVVMEAGLVRGPAFPALHPSGA
ncbi:MAG TPA: hypothetical protein VEL07_23135 [Planctomycetota bacterium]|nr:hypothetical protein [Planctomycetota bacterium]